MSDGMTPPQDESRLRPGRRWLTAAALIAFACQASLLVWSASDASFRIGVFRAKVRLGMEGIRLRDGTILWPAVDDVMRRWDWTSSGKRAIALTALTGVGLAATLAYFSLAIRRRRTIAIAIGCGIVAAWGLLDATHRAVDNWRVRRQVAALFPSIEEAGQALDRQWPDRPGESPPGLSFYVEPRRHPDVLMLLDRLPSSPFREDFGRAIRRGSDGAIRFDLAGAFDSCVEFHPKGTLPSRHRSAFGYDTLTPVAVTPLKENWYLVRYGQN